MVYTTTTLFLGLFLLLVMLTGNNPCEGCDCKLQPPHESFCNADWVAHIRVNARYDNQRMPAGMMVDSQSFSNTRYEMHYNQLFKVSSSMNLNALTHQVAIPVNVYSATEDAGCGIRLEPAHEYLLSGRFINGTMLTQLCGQLLFDDLKESRKHDILEWSQVPEKLKSELNSQAFSKTCGAADTTMQ